MFLVSVSVTMRSNYPEEAIAPIGEIYQRCSLLDTEFNVY